MHVFSAALRVTKAVAVSAASLVVALVLLGRDAEFCLCDPDPDGCGHDCHVCVDESVPHVTSASPASSEGLFLSAADDCRHVRVQAADLLCADGRVTPPSAVCALAAALPQAFLPVRVPHGLRLRATAPPEGGGGLYVRVVTRLFPRA